MCCRHAKVIYDLKTAQPVVRGYRQSSRSLSDFHSVFLLSSYLLSFLHIVF